MATSSTKTAAKRKGAVAKAQKPQKPVPSEFLLPRMPTRGRGKVRYRQLIDATEALLMTNSPEDVGLYQIAEKARVPAASVYHFFRSKEAAFLALSHYYLEQLDLRHHEPINAAEIKSWQDLLAIDMRRAMKFHNEHPPMMKINYGGFGSATSRFMDDLYVQKVATANYGRLDSIFHMPPMRHAEEIFEMRLGIMDAIWAISYRRHGAITEWYFHEAYNAMVAFMLQFLPPRVEPRERLVAAAARGETLSLPFGADVGINESAVGLKRNRARKAG